MRKSITQKEVDAWVEENPTSSFEECCVHFSPNEVLPRRTLSRLKNRYHLAQTHEDKENTGGPEIGGTLESPDKRRDKAQGQTFVFTSAQSNTFLHDNFFKSLLAYCDYKKANLHISRFTYNKHGLGSQNAKVGSGKTSDSDDTWFDPRIEPYVSDTPLEITTDLVWCGELNILPTRANPISGFQTYARQASCIIPHAKMFMESVPTMKHAPAKMIYTTGAVTQRNYIQKVAGQKADFHHVFGALIVEVDKNGDWWVRQINADKEGAFYDLDLYVHPTQGIIDGQRVHAVTHGDLHGNKLDRDVAHAVFCPGGILDSLRPKEQFFHDTVDFQPRNHHNIKDPHFLHEMYQKGTDDVWDEFLFMGKFLATKAYRNWCKSFVVVSNHDQAIEQWLRNPVGQYDPVNVILWHRLNLYCHESRERGLNPCVFKHCLEIAFSKTPVKIIEDVRRIAPQFLLEDDSYRILDEIEAALHGHLGPNGAKGTPRNIRGAGKVNSGHTHSAGIFEGVYTAGVYGQLNMGYNKGLSSWSHSMIVTYPNAKRTILTLKNGKAWR